MRRPRSYPKFKITLSGGPFDGETVWLSASGTTLPFRAKGMRGRYVGGSWEEES